MPEEAGIQLYETAWLQDVYVSVIFQLIGQDRREIFIVIVLEPGSANL